MLRCPKVLPCKQVRLSRPACKLVDVLRAVNGLGPASGSAQTSAAPQWSSMQRTHAVLHRHQTCTSVTREGTKRDLRLPMQTIVVCVGSI